MDGNGDFQPFLCLVIWFIIQLKHPFINGCLGVSGVPIIKIVDLHGLHRQNINLDLLVLVVGQNPKIFLPDGGFSW